MFPYSDPYFAEDIFLSLIPVLVSGIPSVLLYIVSYVLSAMALYTLASRRGIHKAWLSWIPVVNVWILGSLSDQYRYVVKGQIKSKRKFLLVFQLTTLLCSMIVFGTSIYAVVQTAINLLQGTGNHVILTMLTGPVITALCVSLPIFALTIATAVIRYMALYDLYTSMDPENNVLFLVLSILFNVTEPFFLFFGRNKDLGMPPRKQPEPQPEVQEPQQEETPYL